MVILYFGYFKKGSIMRFVLTLLFFWVSTAVFGQALEITPSGNVGIGTSNPFATLEIFGTKPALPTHYIKSDTILSLINSNVPTVGNNYNQNIGGIIGFGGRYNDGNQSNGNFALIQGIKASAINNNLEGALLFNVASAINVLDERMRITSIGNVGIGTATPTTTFAIKPPANLSPWAPGTAFVGGFSILSNNGLYGLVAGVEPSGNTWMQSGRADTATSYPLRLNPNGGNILLCDTTAGGNVGIGLTNPSARLDVVSTTAASWAAQVTNNAAGAGHGLYVNIGASSIGTPFRVDINGVSKLAVDNNGLIQTGGDIYRDVSNVATSYILTNEINTGTKKVVIQAGGGSASYGGSLILYANAHATKPVHVAVGL
jgi:hypothetical protein